MAKSATVTLIILVGISAITDPILTLPEVAALLKVAEKTVLMIPQTGGIPTLKDRGQWRFRHGDIDRSIVEQKAVVKGDTAKAPPHV